MTFRAIEAACVVLGVVGLCALALWVVCVVSAGVVVMCGDE